MTERTRPSVERLRELLEYDHETGEIRWRVRRGKARPGSVAGCPKDNEYLVMGIDGSLYRVHRVAWALYYGEWPGETEDVDHKDGNRTNNRINNLRLATRTQNNANAKRPRHNTSGYKGASYERRREKWESYIQIEGRKRHLGYYDSPEEAHAAYCKAANDLHGEFARIA